MLGNRLRATCDARSFPRTVIFCTQKNILSNIFEYLRECAKHRKYVAMYHSSLSAASKLEIYNEFSAQQSNICVLVATIAFGMVSCRHITEMCNNKNFYRVSTFIILGTCAFMVCQRASLNFIRLMNKINFMLSLYY